MGAVMYCLRRRLDQMCQFRFDQGTPHECAGQSMIGTTPLNWSIFGRRQQTDNEYVLGVVLQAQSYLFPEFVGYCLFKALGAAAHDVGPKLLSTAELSSLVTNFDLAKVRSQILADTWSPGDGDFLYVMWGAFKHCVEQMLAGAWKQQWMMAPNRTRFNYGKTTRSELLKNVDELDGYLRKTELTRAWAVKLNKSKGLFSFLKERFS